jgi:hypothetical protein
MYRIGWTLLTIIIINLSLYFVDEPNRSGAKGLDLSVIEAKKRTLQTCLKLNTKYLR